MIADEFIQKHKIGTALAIGFKEHLRIDPKSDLAEEYLTAAFQEFSGINPDGSPLEETSGSDPRQSLSPVKGLKLSDEGLARTRNPKETVTTEEKK
ncbi:hypothetical protein ACLK29_00855 [Leptospira kirschneri]|uniref:hypothetical protein n=1 Tax=Leptospira kirschneri TaxID=29507 RepID=UPI00398AD1CE